MAANDYVPYDALVNWATANKVNIPPASPPPPTFKFSAPFTDTSNWTVGRTSAYPGSYPNQTNPGDYKADRLGPGPSSSGTFTAARRTDGSGLWDAPLVTTEFSPNAFQLHAGDQIDADIYLPSNAAGSWPAIWTWSNGDNEVDAFEWHPDTAVWEFTNHLASPPTSHYGPAAVAVTSHHLTCVIGTGSVVWYVDGTQVFSDGKGVPANWSAYLIVNLSVASTNNPYHSGPMAGTNSLSFQVSNLTVK